MLKTVKIGIAGLGTVGGGTLDVLTRNADEITRRTASVITVSHIGARRDADATVAAAAKGITISKDVFDVVRDPEVSIVVETIGGTTIAKELVLEAIANGKHVVTANKALIAEFGNEIFAAANAKGVSVAYEAAVAGGIPIIKTMREGLAGNKIEWLAGIINGTGNFILTEMRDKGRAFADVLKEAQELGYAEADPTFDVEGIDAAHKLVILASLAFGIPLQFDKAYTEGISVLATDDLNYAEELGYRIKHLGIAKRVGDSIELRVHPTLIPEKRLIANVDGVMNAVLVKGDAVGPVLSYGAGAGAEPTASAVVADVIDLVRTLEMPAEMRVPSLAFNDDSLLDAKILPITEIESAYYLRLSATDEQGVLAEVSGTLGDLGISIEAILQKESKDESSNVPIVIITNKVKESVIDQAIEKITAMSAIAGSIMRIRIETF